MQTNKNITPKMLFILIMMIGSSAFAAKPSIAKEGKSAERELSTEIKSKIVFPEFLLLQSGSEFFAEVAFKVNREGEILITEINSSDLQLREDMKKQLSQMKFDLHEISPEDTYRVVLRFRLL